MRKAADLYRGRSKTDARDAFILAATARTTPQALRQIDRDSEVPSALKVLAGFDEDLAHETTSALTRIRSHPRRDPEPLVDQTFAALAGSLAGLPRLEGAVAPQFDRMVVWDLYRSRRFVRSVRVTAHLSPVC